MSSGICVGGVVNSWILRTCSCAGFGVVIGILDWMLGTLSYALSGVVVGPSDVG